MKTVGFVLATDQETYLEDFRIDQGGSIFRLWSPLVSSAKVFQSKSQAESVMQKISCSYRLWLLQLLETDTSFVVTTGSTVRPKWLHSQHRVN